MQSAKNPGDARPTVRLELSNAAFEALVERVAEIVLERQAEQVRSKWPEWMSVETAARYLDVSVERLYKLKDRGAIPCYQEAPGCRVFFKRRELDACMEGYRA